VREKALIIPEAALLRESTGVRVFVVDKNQTAQLKSVTEGVHLPGWVEITAGLEEDEQVIVEGTQKTTPGAKVKLAPPEAAAHYQRLGVSETEKRPE
jgi:membrane fusion protein (multidrug efflux system)